MRQGRNSIKGTNSKEKYSWAQWAANLCVKYNRRRILIRQLHYYAILQKSMQKPDGSRYRNCVDDLLFLKTGCRLARQMNLLPYDVFECSGGNGFSSRSLLMIPELFGGSFDNAIDHFLMSYTNAIIKSILPVHVEVWLENSTAMNLLVPVTTKFNVNLLAYRTNIPLNTVWKLVREFSRLDRPILILHYSDLVKYKDGCLATAFDKVKALICQYRLAKKIDIHYEHMMLTGGQFCQFNLPKPPDSKTCSSMTCSKVGELHALEAVCPGFVSRRLESKLREHLNPDDITKAKRIIDLTHKVAYTRLRRNLGESDTTKCVINALRAEMRGDCQSSTITHQGN